MKTRDDHLAFIKLNHVAIAATAWEGFQEKGRGVVCVLCDEHDEMKKMVPFSFMPLLDVKKMIQPWKGTKEAKMIYACDPKTELVIVFVRSNGNRHQTSCYRITPPTPPPLAAEM